MTAFSIEDVAEIAQGGNVVHNAKYLAKHGGKDSSIPSGNDATKRREFIRTKYIDKKWYSEDGTATVDPSIAAPSVRRASMSTSISIKPLGQQVTHKLVSIAYFQFVHTVQTHFNCVFSICSPSPSPLNAFHFP